MQATIENQRFEVSDPQTGWKITFACSAKITSDEEGFDSMVRPWETVALAEDRLLAQCDCGGVVQEVEIRWYEGNGSAEIHHRIRNSTASVVVKL